MESNNRMESLDRVIQIMDEHFKNQDKERERKKPLPEKLYHVTTKQNISTILGGDGDGLNPTKLKFEDKEVVCLSDDIDFALRVAQNTQNTDPRNLAVLEIDTQYLLPSRTHNYLRKADPSASNPVDAAEIHEVHYDGNIPSDAIKLIKIPIS